MQINLSLGRMNGISLAQEKESTQMGLGLIEQLCLDIGKLLAQTRQSKVDQSKLG
jgi:hypothetical protein